MIIMIIMKKIILALALCFVITSTAFADRVPEFSGEFPTLARCTGNKVNLRDEPGTDGTKVINQLNNGDFIVALDRVIVEGEMWYEVDNPNAKGSAFMFSKYIEPVYEEEYQMKPLHKLIMNLYLTFGMTPQKAKLLDKAIRKREVENIGSDNIVRIYMHYKDFDLEYLDGTLVGVQVKRGKKPFGNIKIGDSVEKLEDELGRPNRQEAEGIYSYQEGEMTYINFELKNNKVSGMSYQVYYDIE